jgi:mannuronan synthase
MPNDQLGKTEIPGHESAQRASGGAWVPGLPDPNPLPAEYRRGADWLKQLCMLCVLIAVGYTAWHVLHSHRFSPFSWTTLFTMSALGIWRWSWAGLHYCRAAIYRYVYFPWLRRRAERIVAEQGPVPELIVLATTYHERPWITKRVFGSIVNEFATLRGLRRPPLLIVVTGGDDDDQALHEILDARLSVLVPADTEMWPPELVLLRGENGKRPAIASGLREIAARQPDKDCVVLLMDGDSALAPGLMRRVLSIFRLPQRFAAVTTNEQAFVNGPDWFREWITLRFGLRHLYMCSISLSHRLLCLTGRLSAFRAEVTTNPEFLDQVENDHLNHWLFGEYHMLSGDDKSTWFWLAKRQYPLLYVPDAMVTTFEVVTERPATKRAIANMKRWSGNMLRNSRRAIAIGPRKLGIFAWLCTLDQQISIWTVLVGPLACLLAVAAGRFHFVAAYTLWVLGSRTLRVLAACRHGRRISAYYIPMQVASEWGGGMLKVWTWFHPVKQSWLNRGARTLDSTKGHAHRALRGGLATYFCGCTLLVFVFGIASFSEIVPFLRDARLSFFPRHARPATVRASAAGRQQARGGDERPVEYFGMSKAQDPVTPSTQPRSAAPLDVTAIGSSDQSLEN